MTNLQPWGQGRVRWSAVVLALRLLKMGPFAMLSHQTRQPYSFIHSYIHIYIYNIYICSTAADSSSEIYVYIYGAVETAGTAGTDTGRRNLHT